MTLLGLTTTCQCYRSSVSGTLVILRNLINRRPFSVVGVLHGMQWLLIGFWAIADDLKSIGYVAL
jgi:hypothetical protein